MPSACPNCGETATTPTTMRNAKTREERAAWACAKCEQKRELDSYCPSADEIPALALAVRGETMTWKIHDGDVLAVLPTLPAEHFHCVVTSPPYFALRDYGVDGQIGLEPTPAEYIAKMVDVFRQVRRVMRDDGTLWLNIGDSYNAHPGQRKTTDDVGPKQLTNEGSNSTGSRSVPCCKPKDLIGIPWQLAFALRDDGWYLRSEIIWHKRAPMPESVRDRPTKAHEQIFLLTKEPRYFYDSIGVAEMATHAGQRAGYAGYSKRAEAMGREPSGNEKPGAVALTPSTRNMRSVWTLSPESFSGAHFATFPTELVRRCLLAGTSEKGCCPFCGAPWQRIVDKQRVATRPGDGSKVNGQGSDVTGNRDPERHVTSTTTLGWASTCDCGEAEPSPCRVLDPFNGAGTTGMVARRLGLHYDGIELNPTYAAMARKRIRDDAPLLNS